jgi:5-methylcytosine-specific restriction protein A
MMREKRRPLIGLCEATQLYGASRVTFIRPRYVPDGICEWCGKPITKKRRKSCCCKECTTNFLIATSTLYYANSGSRGGYANHILRRDNYTCQECGEFHAEYNENGIPMPTSDGRLEIHHIVAVRDGGDDSPQNLVTLCKVCHQKHTQEQRRIWGSAPDGAERSGTQ